MAYIETRGGTKLFYKDWGHGDPVVFIHGWPLNADMWEYQMPTLAHAGLRCIAYDRRGFGRSDQPWTGYDYDTLADDLAALLDGLDLKRVTLVGFSMGGGEVARYLSRHGSGRVARAVLLAAVTPFLLKTADNPNGADKAVFDDMVAGLEKDRPDFLTDFGKLFFGAGMLNFSVSSAILQWSQSMALQASPKATVDCVRAFGTTDFRPDMAAFAGVPTLIIHGTSDGPVPIDASGRAAAKLIPHAELKEYSGAPHALFFTEKDRLNADLLAFVRG